MHQYFSGKDWTLLLTAVPVAELLPCLLGNGNKVPVHYKVELQLPRVLTFNVAVVNRRRSVAEVRRELSDHLCVLKLDLRVQGVLSIQIYMRRVYT